jgi:sensor domain CHASE-containing protein
VRFVALAMLICQLFLAGSISRAQKIKEVTVSGVIAGLLVCVPAWDATPGHTRTA